MKRITRIIATILLAVMLMITLTGCNRYYYYYYINNILGGSGSGSSSLPSNGLPSNGDTDIGDKLLYQVIFTGLWNTGGTTTDGNPSNLTKAWARLMESILPHKGFKNGNEGNIVETDDFNQWANKTYQSVTVISSENCDKIAEECGLAWNRTFVGATPAIDDDVIAAAKDGISKYGEKYYRYFVTVIKHPVGGSPDGLASVSTLYQFCHPLGENMIAVSTDSNPNIKGNFINAYDEGTLVYTLGTYRIDEIYVALVLGAS